MSSTPRTGVLKSKNSVISESKTPSTLMKGKENIATKLMRPTASWLEKTRSKFISKKSSTENLTLDNDSSMVRNKTTNFQRNSILRKTITNTGATPKTSVSTKPPSQRRSQSFIRNLNKQHQQQGVENTSDEDSGINTPRSLSTPLDDVPPLVNIAVVENHLEYLLEQVQETEKTVRYYNRAVYEEAKEENQYLVEQLVKKNEEIEELRRKIDELNFKLHHAEAVFSPNKTLLDNETCPTFVQNGDGLIKLFEVVEKLQEEFVTVNKSEKSFSS